MEKCSEQDNYENSKGQNEGDASKPTLGGALTALSAHVQKAEKPKMKPVDVDLSRPGNKSRATPEEGGDSDRGDGSGKQAGVRARRRRALRAVDAFLAVAE